MINQDYFYADGEWEKLGERERRVFDIETFDRKHLANFNEESTENKPIFVPKSEEDDS